MDNNSKDGNDILGMEAAFEAEALRKKVSELEKEVLKLKQVIKENDIDVSDVSDVSDEEYICVKQINKLVALSDELFDQETTKIFDTLVKDLYIIRGKHDPGNKRGKKITKEDRAKLIKIAKEQA